MNHPGLNTTLTITYKSSTQTTSTETSWPPSPATREKHHSIFGVLDEMLDDLKVSPSYVSTFSDTESQHENKGLVTPPDGGFDAWVFLIAAFMIEAICWGFPSAAGVLVSYYQSQPEFANQDIVTSIGTVATGVSGLMNPVIFYIGARYPGQRLNFIRAGVLICVVAAFSTTAVAVFLTQGLLWGFGSALCIVPVLSLLPEWFERRKGFAYGVMFGGAGLTGAGLPFLFNILLDKYGQKIVLLGWAAITFVALVPCVLFTRGNFPLEQIGPAKSIQWSLYKTPLFAVLGAVIFLQGAVNYVPPSYLPIFAADVGLESWKQAFLLAALNVALIPGQMTFGWLGDVYGSYLILTLGGLTSGLTVMLIWGFARDFTFLLIFALTYGIVTGGVTTSRSTFATTLTKDCSDPSQEVILFGILRFIGGLGGIIAGIGSSALIPDIEESFGTGFAGGSWTALVVFTGSVFLFTSVGYFGKFLKN